MSRKQRIGVVISNKASKTIIVAIQNSHKHPKYKKILKRTKRYMAHDEMNSSNNGDIVLCVATKLQWILIAGY